MQFNYSQEISLASAFFFAHLAAAAFFAISDLSSGVSLAALAVPPLRPPFLPIADSSDADFPSDLAFPPKAATALRCSAVIFTIRRLASLTACGFFFTLAI